MKTFLCFCKIFVFIIFQSTLSHSWASETVLLCKKIDLINPKGNIGIVYDSFAIEINQNKDMYGYTESIVFYGSNQFKIDIRATVNRYIGFGDYVEQGLDVISLLIERIDGSSWLALRDNHKNYSYTIYSRCKSRAL